jgi:hypothetical protein
MKHEKGRNTLDDFISSLLECLLVLSANTNAKTGS